MWARKGIRSLPATSYNALSEFQISIGSRMALSVDNCCREENVPTESLVRAVTSRSQDVSISNCTVQPFALPSIIAHAKSNLKGFRGSLGGFRIVSILLTEDGLECIEILIN